MGTFTKLKKVYPKLRQKCRTMPSQASWCPRWTLSLFTSCLSQSQLSRSEPRTSKIIKLRSSLEWKMSMPQETNSKIRSWPRSMNQQKTLKSKSRSNRESNEYWHSTRSKLKISISGMAPKSRKISSRVRTQSKPNLITRWLSVKKSKLRNMPLPFSLLFARWITSATRWSRTVWKFRKTALKFLKRRSQLESQAHSSFSPMIDNSYWKRWTITKWQFSHRPSYSTTNTYVKTLTP